ncbi:cysteine hydrolase family protein [Arthrobacter sp. 35W]|uniref:cysteine hydrolase family protein n=1 Tax=Arthrobacter sp. 35W TaxID=1132441 RepID=UPI0004272615|nr:cysteine hydrolase [Arthrobacter sp. 35W]
MSTPAARPQTLVVIDMQRGFRDPASQWCVPRYDEIVPAIEALQERIGGSAVFTRFVPDPEEPGAWQAYYRRWHQMCQAADAPAWGITMAVPAGSPIVTKPTFSKWGPELEALVPLGGEMVLTGVATDCCILSTALGAVDAGRFVTVVSDGCAAVGDEAQAQTLALLDLLSPMVRIATSAELLAALPAKAPATA